MAQKRVLIAEDEKKSFLILKRVFVDQNWSVESASDGEEALRKLKQSSFDILLTDLNMPKMNGMELIGRVRAGVKPIPLTIMFTAYHDPEIRKRALELGVHDFLTKPVDLKKLFSSIFNGLSTIHRKNGKASSSLAEKSSPIVPPLVGVVIASSFGGPQTLTRILDSISTPFNCAIFLVQHGPDWSLSSLAQSLNKGNEFEVQLATDGLKPETDNVYIAPGNRHLYIDADSFRFKLVDSPPENFVRPAADPLFRSAATTFGSFCAAVILTGMGRDGGQGIRSVAEMGGTVLIQDPKTALMPSMPKAAINTGVQHQIVALDRMGETIMDTALRLSETLTENSSLLQAR